MNDEPRMKVLLEAAAKDYAEYQVKMTARANECSKLEISIRRDQFRKKFYDLIHIMALSHVVVAKIEGDGFPSGMKVTQEELASKITFDTLYDLTFEQLKAVDWIMGNRSPANSPIRDPTTTILLSRSGIQKIKNS